MEKKTLTRFETLCIQEEPAFCTAACPFHTDVKAFLSEMAEQAFDKAFKILERTLPLPEVLARICDHPCESACIRKTCDEAIAVGDLERACVRNRSRQKKYFAQPPKDKSVGVWGSGPSSLTAAWDLSLKGFNVTVFEGEDRLGGHLSRLSETVLPAKVLDREISRLKGFGVSFRTNTAFSVLDDQRGDFDALFIGYDAEGGPARPPDVDPFSLRSGDSKVFCGGFSDDGPDISAESSPVAFAYQGRKAATSIDRILSAVSLTAGREKEGPVRTRLSTDISRIVPAPKTQFIQPDEDGRPSFDTALAAREAARCHQCDCSRCVRACNAYIESFGGFPGRYAREIYNNLSIVMGERKANVLINSCTLCELCTEVCPNDFSMADLCLAAREEMTEKDTMPPSAHEFALAEMDHALGEACAFARHAKGYDRSEVLFFPGCQLTGSAPDQVMKAYEWLVRHDNPATGIVAGCCGAPAHWAGRADRCREVLEGLKALWTAWGEPQVVTACSSCAKLLQKVLPEGKLVSLYAKLAGNIPDTGGLRLDGPVAVIDPCTARKDADVRAAVRDLVCRAGLVVEELAASGELTECCGFGGLTFNANPHLAGQITAARAKQGDQDYVAYCAMCRDRLARAGKRTYHVLDLFWPPDLPSSSDGGSRPDPGFSGRRQNRARFRELLLAAFGEDTSVKGGDDPDLAAPSGRQIRIAPELAERLEDQFILKQDVRQVIGAFEADGSRGFSHSERKTRIVSHRAGPVRFWVEFGRDEDGYEVKDAWCHRMEVAESKAFKEGKPDPGHDPSVCCHACDGKLVFCKNHVEYLGSRFDVDLPQCPGCGAVFVSSTLSRTKMAEVEHILEDK